MGKIISILAVLAILATAWWLFGWETVDDPRAGVVRSRRVLGKVLVIDRDWNRDGAFETRLRGTLDKPLDGPYGTWQEILEDHNGDGEFDLWLRRLDDEIEADVDMDFNGSIDWSFRAPNEERARSDIKERRGL